MNFIPIGVRERFLLSNSTVVFLSVFVLAFFGSCKEKEEGEVVKKINDTEKIHFYVENSASMGGFFKGDSEFKTNISDLSVKINERIRPISIWFIADSMVKYGKSPQQFSSDIATTSVATQKSSQIHKIIENISAKNDSNDISIFISDCILSFPDAAIKKNPEINKTEAPNALKSGIYSIFSNLNKKGFVTSVYAFTSKFYGIYYDYQNVKHDFSTKGIDRPYYVWVIGSKELVSKFNSKLNEISSFKPQESLHFGSYNEAINEFDIIPQIERKGKFVPDTKGLRDIEIVKNESIQFAVAVNLEGLPEYAKDNKYISENLLIINTGCNVTFSVKSKNEVDKSKLKSNPQIVKLEKSSHVILIKLVEMPLQEATIHVTLPLKYSTWFEDWSVPDDKKIESVGIKTFAFNHLINGVKEAYETKNTNYMDFTITLNK